jgi:dipeptidyl aminopeptidase/acylaminoacyl peptidase
VTMQLRAAANAQRADAARLGVQALAEPDARRSLLLAVAAARLEPSSAGVVRTALQRTPDLVATSGEGVTAIALSPDGTMMATGSTGGPIRLLRSDTLALAATLDYPGHGPVNGLAFTPDGRRLVSWGGSRTSAGTDAASIVIWDVASRRPTGSAFGQVWPDQGGGLLADRETLVLAQHGRDPQAPATAVAWSIESRTPSTAYPLPTSTVESLVVSADGRQIAIGSGGNTVVLTVADGKTHQLPGARQPMAFSPDGRSLLAVAGEDIQVWDVARTQARIIAAHRGQILAAAWSPDGTSFATAGADGSAVMWSNATAAPLRSFSAGPVPMTAVAFASDNQTLYAVGANGTALAFDLTGNRGVATVLAGTADSDPALLRLGAFDDQPRPPIGHQLGTTRRISAQLVTNCIRCIGSRLVARRLAGARRRVPRPVARHRTVIKADTADGPFGTMMQEWPRHARTESPRPGDFGTCACSGRWRSTTTGCGSRFRVWPEPYSRC